MAKHLASVGRIASALSIGVDLVQKLASELNIESELVLDGVHYFAADTTERMRHRINAQKAGTSTTPSEA